MATRQTFSSFTEESLQQSYITAILLQFHYIVMKREALKRIFEQSNAEEQSNFLFKIK